VLRTKCHVRVPQRISYTQLMKDITTKQINYGYG